VVAPLIPVETAPAKLLNPVFPIDGPDHVLLTQAMASVPVSALGRERADLSDRQDRITRAVDMLFRKF